MTQMQYAANLQQSKQIIILRIKQLSQTVKINQQKLLSQSLSNILSSIATFDEDFIKGSVSMFSSNIEIQSTIQKILSKIKEAKQFNQKVIEQKQKQKKAEQPQKKLKTTSQIVSSKSIGKQTKPQSSNNSKKDNSQGLLGGVFGKFLGGGNKNDKPKAHQMILPQKQSKAIYDLIKKKWIFQGQQEQPQKQIPKPPPKFAANKSQLLSEASLSVKQPRKLASQLDELTAPPSFRRKGHSKSGGGLKKMVIYQQVLPITLVQDQNNPFDQLMNMVDKQFYRLQQQLNEVQHAVRSQHQRELRARSQCQKRPPSSQQLQQSQMRTILNGSTDNNISKEQSLTQIQRNTIQQIKKEIEEVSLQSERLILEYLDNKGICAQCNLQAKFDSELTMKMMRIAKDNRIVKVKFQKQSRVRSNSICQQHQEQTCNLKQQISELKENLQKQKIKQKPAKSMLPSAYNGSDQLQSLRQQVDSLGLDCRILRQQVQQKDSQIQQLKSKLNHQNQLELSPKESLQLQRLQAQLRTVQQENLKLTRQLETMKQRQQLYYTTRSLSVSQKVNEDLRNPNRQQPIGNQSTSKLNQIDQIQVLNQQISTLNQKLSLSNRKLQQFREQINQQTRVIQKLQKQTNQSKIQLLTSSQKIIQLNQAIQDQKMTRNQLVQQRCRLLQQNSRLQHLNQSSKTQLPRLQESNRLLCLQLRHQQIAHQQQMKSNLDQLENFAYQIYQQGNLLSFIQSKQQQLQKSRPISGSQRSSSQNSSGKSDPDRQNQNQNSIANQQKIPGNASFVNLSDILTQMTKQYMDKATQMRYQYAQIQHQNKSLCKQWSKQKQRYMNQIQSLKKSIYALQSLNEGYKKSRKQVQDRSLCMQAQNQKLRKKVGHLKSQQAANRELLQQALEQKHMNNHSLSMLRGDKEQIQGRIQQLQEQLQLKNQQMQQFEQLRRQLSQKQEVISQRNSTIARLEDTLAEESQYYTETLHRKQAESKTLLRSRDQQLSKLRRQLQLATNRYQKLERQYKAHKDNSTSKVQQLQSLRKQLQKQLKSLQSQLTLFSQSLSSKQFEGDKLKTQNLQLTGQVDELMKANHIQTLQTQQIKSQLHSLKQQNCEQIFVIEQINTQKYKLQSHVRNIQKQLYQLNVKQGKLVEQVHGYKLLTLNGQRAHRQKVAQMQTHIQQLQQQYQGELAKITEEAVGTVKRQKEQLQNSLEYALATYNQIRKDFEEVRVSMGDRINYLISELQNSHRQGQQLSSQLGGYSQAIEKMTAHIEGLQRQLGESRSFIEQLRERQQPQPSQQQQQHLAQVLQLLDGKQTQLYELSQKLNTALSKVQTLQAQNQGLELSLSQKNVRENESLLNQHNQLMQNYASIYKMYDELQEKLNGNQRDLKMLRDRVLDLGQNVTSNRDISNSVAQFRNQKSQPSLYKEFIHTLSQLIQKIGFELIQLQSQKLSSQEKVQQLSSQVHSLLQSSEASAKEIQQLKYKIIQTSERPAKEIQQLKSKFIQTCEVSGREILQLKFKTIQTSERSAKETQQLKDEISELNRRSGQLDQNNTELVAMVDNLGLQNQQKSEQIAQLHKQKQQLSQLIQRLSGQVQSLKGVLAMKQIKQQQSEKQQEVPRQQFLDLASQYQELLEEFQQTKEKLVQLQKTKQINCLLEDENYQLRQEKCNHLKRKSLQQLDPAQEAGGQLNNNGRQTDLPAQQNEQLNEIVIELSMKLEKVQSQNHRLQAENMQLKQHLFQQKQLSHALKQKTNEIELVLQKLSQQTESKDKSIQQRLNEISDKDLIIQGLSKQLQLKNQQLARLLGDIRVQQSPHQPEQIAQTFEGPQYKHQQRSKSLDEMQELLQTFSEQLEEKKVKQIELMQIISLQEVQISMLREKVTEITDQKVENNLPNTANLAYPPETQLTSQRQQQQSSSQLYQVIQQMQKDLQGKNQQIQQLNLLIDRVNEQVRRDVQMTQGVMVPQSDDDGQRTRDNQQRTRDNQQRNRMNQQRTRDNQQQRLSRLQSNLDKMSQQLSQRDSEIQNQKMYAQILRQEEEKMKNRIQDLEKANQELLCQIQSLNDILSKQGEFEQQERRQDGPSNFQQLQLLVTSMQQELILKDQQVLERGNELHKFKHSQMQDRQEIQSLKQQLQRSGQQMQAKDQTIRLMRQIVLAASIQVNQVKLQKDQLTQMVTQSHKQIYMIKKESQPKANDAVSEDLNDNGSEQQVRELKQLIASLGLELKLHKQIIVKKELQIEQMNQLVNSQALDIQRNEDRIEALERQLIETGLKYRESLKQQIKANQLQTVNEEIVQVQSTIQNGEQPAQSPPVEQRDHLLKAQLQQAYQQLRNQKIMVDQLRRNVFEVKQMFSQREAKYQAKIKSLQKQLHKFEKSRETFVKYDNDIRELELEISALTSEKVEFLRVNESLQKVIQDYQKTLEGKNQTNNGSAKLSSMSARSESVSDKKLRSTRSQIIESQKEVKPTGFFGSISSLFMTPLQTERLAKTIVKK